MKMITKWIGKGRRLIFVADSAFNTYAVLNLARELGVAFISVLRWDAALYDFPPEAVNKRGRRSGFRFGQTNQPAGCGRGHAEQGRVFEKIASAQTAPLSLISGFLDKRVHLILHDSSSLGMWPAAEWPVIGAMNLAFFNSPQPNCL